jgi:hypothetical protein
LGWPKDRKQEGRAGFSYVKITCPGKNTCY